MSRSFFSDPNHFHFFGPAFDLTNDHLTSEEKKRLIGIIAETFEEYPDCREVTLALASLYESVGDYISAHSTLIDDYFFSDSSLCMIRKAFLNHSGDEEYDENLLAKLTKRHDDPQLMRRLYAFLGFTLMKDDESAEELWHNLLEETLFRPPSGTDDILDYSYRYSVFHNLSFREQIEGIRYLLRAGISDNLEVELVSFTEAIPSYLKNLLSLIMLFTSDTEDAEIVDPLTVVIAAAFGSVEIIDGFLADIEERINEVFLEYIDLQREEAVTIGEEAIALIHLLNRADDPILHEEGFYDEFERLMLSTNPAVLIIADWIIHQIPAERLQDLPPEYQTEYFRKRAELLEEYYYEDETDDEDTSLEELEERTPDEILILSPEEVIELDDIELLFSYLRDHISDGNYLDMSVTFIELGLDLDRMDEVFDQKTVFLEHNCKQALTLINSYLFVLDRNYKRAEALIQEGEMDPDEAALFLARIYLQTESPKKAVEICEKLLKKKRIRVDPYPLLIQAYRAAGSEKKAQKAERAMKSHE